MKRERTFKKLDGGMTAIKKLGEEGTWLLRTLEGVAIKKVFFLARGSGAGVSELRKSF